MLCQEGWKSIKMLDYSFGMVRWHVHIFSYFLSSKVSGPRQARGCVGINLKVRHSPALVSVGSFCRLSILFFPSFSFAPFSFISHCHSFTLLWCVVDDRSSQHSENNNTATPPIVDIFHFFGVFHHSHCFIYSCVVFLVHRMLPIRHHWMEVEEEAVLVLPTILLME